MNRMDPDVRKKSMELQFRLDRTPLTKREKEVVSLLVSGASTRAIAEQTKLTVATVHTYLKRIYSKLGVHSRVELVARMMGTAGTARFAGDGHDHEDELDDDEHEHDHDHDHDDDLGVLTTHEPVEQALSVATA
jgi:DNA-binding CsgD family transcriptional regulator